MSKDKDPELNSIINGFEMFGSETEGLINPNELKEIMETMNMHEKNPFLYNIITNFCSDPQIQQKGGIEAEDFISQLDQELEDVSSLEGIEKLFSIFFNPMTNTIPITTFSQIAKNVGDEDNEDKLKKLITKSKLGDKELDINQFHQIVKTESPKKEIKNIVYKKKISQEVRESFHSHIKSNNNSINNKINDNEKINNNGNNVNNNNLPYNSNHNNMFYDSMNSLDKNSEIYNYINKKPLLIYDNNKYNINKEIKYENNNLSDNNMNNFKLKKSSSGRKIENDYINNDKNNFDNANNNLNNIDFNNKNINKNHNYKRYELIENGEVKIIEKNNEEIMDYNKKIENDIKMVKINSAETNDNNDDNNDNKHRVFKYGKPIKEDNDENTQEVQDEVRSSYINKLTKGRIEKDKNENQFDKKEEDKINNDSYNINEEKTETKSSKRYHRRYREIKTNTPDKKDAKLVSSSNEDNKSSKNSSNYTRYRRKK